MKKIALLVALAVIVIAAFGFYFLKNKNLPNVVQAIAEPTTYQVSTTHNGPLVKTTPLSVNYNDKSDLAVASTPNELTSIIQKYQRVILFDKDKNILPFPGKVSFVRSHDKGADIVIALPKETNTALLYPSVEIITTNAVGLPRLPLSVIQLDENKKEFVWVAEPSAENYQARRQYVTSQLRNDDYIAVNGQKVKYNDLVIFNPDDALNKKRNITIEEIEFKAPLHDPIRQAWKEADLRKLEQKRMEIAKRVEECQNRSQNPDENTALRGQQSFRPGESACGAIGDIPSALQIFENLNISTP